MAGNYGTTGYGISSAAPAGKTAIGASNPWVGVAQMVVGAMASPRSGAMDEAHKQQLTNTGGKDINAESQSPFGVADTMGSQMMPGAEKMLPVNWKPLEVGEGSTNTQAGPVDSSQQEYSSKMQDYLNYMKYRGQ